MKEKVDNVFGLAVETSGRRGSVAVGIGGKILKSSNFSGAMRHSSELFPTIADLVEQTGKKPQEIEHIYVTTGPGSFTGLRIGVTRNTEKMPPTEENTEKQSVEMDYFIAAAGRYKPSPYSGNLTVFSAKGKRWYSSFFWKFWQVFEGK